MGGECNHLSLRNKAKDAWQLTSEQRHVWSQGYVVGQGEWDPIIGKTILHKNDPVLKALGYMLLSSGLGL